MSKIKVGVLMGGPSVEREVSLITGKEIFANLDRKKYTPFLIEMTKDRHFVLQGKKKRNLDFINKDRKFFDIIFFALHGSPGEDGTVQGMFEMLGIKYTGPNTLSSALAMNKVYAGLMYNAWHLPHPEFIDITAKNWKKSKKEILRAINDSVGYPAVVKPVDQGSAVGVTIVKTEDDLIKAVNKTIKNFSWLMAQKFIKGKEGTCGVLEKKGEVFALPPTHILPQAGAFYDYKSKYSEGGSKHICPADFPHEVIEMMQGYAIKAHKALNCSGVSRTDMFYGDDGKIYVLETNTIPGMTPTSLLPEAASKVNIDFSKLLDLIIEAALQP
ncbi:MAG: D-alanine--D-alanine ligase [Candidatus Magasanikbacteria bacterium]